jgi:L-threonylcarbamoyladenylate synthase
MPQVSIAALIAAARAGRLIGFPTDTVPALAAHPAAAAEIYAAKQRTLDKPLILMAATADALWPFVQGNSAAQSSWKSIAQQYWPGALTLVLPKSDRVPSTVNPETPNTIGIRVPNWPFAQMILQQTGPLATTSLNRSGQSPLEDLDAIASEFPSVFTPTLDIWDLPREGDSSAPRVRIPSTVVKWSEQGWIVLREGAVKLQG